MLSFCYDISLLDVSITVVVNRHGLFCFREAEHHSGGIFLDPRSSGSPRMTSVNLPNHCQLRPYLQVPPGSGWTLGGFSIENPWTFGGSPLLIYSSLLLTYKDIKKKDQDKYSRTT